MFQEKDVEKYLLNKIRYADTFSIPCDYVESLKLNSQVRMGSYGVADIIATYRDFTPEGDINCLDLIEIKMTDIASYKEIGQLMRYLTALKSGLAKQYDKTRVILVCQDIYNNDDFVFLVNHLYTSASDIEFYIYTFSISLENGIHFNLVDSGWKRTAEGSLVKDLKFLLPKKIRARKKDKK